MQCQETFAKPLGRIAPVAIDLAQDVGAYKSVLVNVRRLLMRAKEKLVVAKKLFLHFGYDVKVDHGPAKQSELGSGGKVTLWTLAKEREISFPMVDGQKGITIAVVTISLYPLCRFCEHNSIYST